jgi:hypothetical protein
VQAEGRTYGITTLPDETWLGAEMKRRQIMKVTDVRQIVGILESHRRTKKGEAIETRKLDWWAA